MPMKAERRREYMRDYCKRVVRPARQRLIKSRVGVCDYCGVAGPVFPDHVVPVSRGGTDEPGHIRPACRLCNMSKGSRLLEEWRAALARRSAGVPNFSLAQRTWLLEHMGVDP